MMKRFFVLICLNLILIGLTFPIYFTGINIMFEIPSWILTFFLHVLFISQIVKYYRLNTENEDKVILDD